MLGQYSRALRRGTFTKLISAFSDQLNKPFNSKSNKLFKKEPKKDQPFAPK